MDKQELMTELEGLKSTLETAITEKTKSEIAEQLKAAIANVDEKINTFANSTDNAETVKAMADEINVLKSEQAELVKGFDVLQSKVKNNKASKMEKKSFNDVFAEGLKDNFEAISNVKKGQPFKMELKTPGTMLLDNSLTGDGVASYSATQAIFPAQKVNFRDLLPTSISPTGLYVQYREGATDGSVGVQNEGSSKNQIQYTFSEIKVVEDYIAGFARFSKQMAKQLPYMQGTLPRLLTRDFYSAENANFWSTVTGAADGNNTSTGADYVEVIMELIGNQQAANFNASVVIVNPATLAKINKNLLTKGYYPGAAGVNSLASGALTISGTPVVGASFATAETALIIDRDYLERVETESINIEFAMEDADNFTKNLITARIECQEAINLMLPASAIFFDFS
jgi:hypothetical protein